MSERGAGDTLATLGDLERVGLRAHARMEAIEKRLAELEAATTAEAALARVEVALSDPNYRAAVDGLIKRVGLPNGN